METGSAVKVRPRWWTLAATGLATAAVVASSMLMPGVATAAQNKAGGTSSVNAAGPAAQVSFTFDDGTLNALTQAAPTLKKHGLTGTDYVITNCVGMWYTPNSCRADKTVPYMSWSQVRQLQSQYGWEIGSHGLDHTCLASAGGDCQARKLTAAQVDLQLSSSQLMLALNGITAKAFAPPYGDYDQTVMAKAAQYYTSMRGFKDVGTNRWPYSDYLINNVPVQEGVDTVDSLKTKIDQAIESKTWVVFTFHNIVPTPSANPDDYQFGTAELDQLASYVKSKVAEGQIKNVNISDGLVQGTANKLPNSSFDWGLSQGWRTDAPTRVRSDFGSNGSYPDAFWSLKLTSGTAPTHVFAPQVAVSPTSNYVFKSFLNVSTVTTGEVSFYVDEYDASGNWISGQYLARENSKWVEDLNFGYTPSSANVAKASVQVSVEGTGILAYLDNVQMYTVDSAPQPFAANLKAAGGSASYVRGLYGNYKNLLQASSH